MRSARSSTLALVLAASTIALAGCGATASDEARKLRSYSVIAAPRPVIGYIVSERRIAQAPPGSPERALLRHWADLQAADWAAAARDFEPGLRGVIGDGLLRRALVEQGAEYRSSRPASLSATTRGDHSVTRYVRAGSRSSAQTSTSWSRDRRGRWLITYDGPLDDALARVRLLETQLAIAPLSQAPAPAALRAAAAARTLQRRYARGG